MVQARKQKRLKKVLIIKLGYSETLDRALTLNSSLGDVLRTTFILYYFKDCEVTWLVDERAAPLIEDNRYVKHVLVYNPSTLAGIKNKRFDTIVNFEKSPEICEMSDSIAAARRFGFRFRRTRDRAPKKHYLGGDRKLVALSQSTGERNKNACCWQEILAESVGRGGRESLISWGTGPGPGSGMTWGLIGRPATNGKTRPGRRCTGRGWRT